MLKASEILKEMDGIVARAENESRGMTAEEVTEFDALKVRYDAAVIAEATAAQRATTETASRRILLAAAHADAALATAAPLATRTRSPGDAAPKTFASLAEFFDVVLSSDPRDSRQDPRLQFENYGDGKKQVGVLIPAEFGPRAEQRFDTGSSGGFLIPQQRSNEVLRIPPKAAIVRPRARVIQPGTPPDAEITFPALDQTGTVPGNVFGGVTVFHEGEGNTMQESDADFREVTLKPKQISGFIKLTNKSLMNSAALGAFCAQALPQAIDLAEDFDFISGNGLGRALGFLNAACAATKSVARTTGSTVKYADLVKMAARLLSDTGGVWLISRSCYEVIVQIQDNSGSAAGLGQYIFNAQTNELLGYPVVWNFRQPSLGSAGDVALVDLSYYLIKDGSGPFVAWSDQVYWTSNRTAVKIVFNVDGQPWLSAPFKNEDGYETSPFVSLAA